MDLSAKLDDEHAGHVFISYVREDSRRVDELEQVFVSAGIDVWRDTRNLWPGEDWSAKIRQAITNDALAFVVCFSRASAARMVTYQNEELVLAVEQMRRRRPDRPWLIPVRFDDSAIPDLDIGGGRMLAAIQSADLFGDGVAEATARLVGAVLRILGRDPGRGERSMPGPATGSSHTNETRLTDGDWTRPAVPARLTLYDLRPVVNVVAEAFPGQGQIDSIASACELRNVRYPTGLADEKQLWRAVFKAALEARPEKLTALLDIIGDDIGDQWRPPLTAALREAGIS